MDAIGGGGWGPLVASTLIAGGDSPRRAVGSVNLAEFFITVSVSVTFLMQLDLAQYGKLVLGLIIGGAMAAPLAGYFLRVLSTRVALVLVGIVVAALSLVNLVSLFSRMHPLNDFRKPAARTKVESSAPQGLYDHACCLRGFLRPFIVVTIEFPGGVVPYPL